MKVLEPMQHSNATQITAAHEAYIPCTRSRHNLSNHAASIVLLSVADTIYQ
jgi:hypothetical protein